jgi:hypothetical protein
MGEGATWAFQGGVMVLANGVKSASTPSRRS